LAFDAENAPYVHDPVEAAAIKEERDLLAVDCMLRFDMRRDPVLNRTVRVQWAAEELERDREYDPIYYVEKCKVFVDGYERQVATLSESDLDDLPDLAAPSDFEEPDRFFFHKCAAYEKAIADRKAVIKASHILKGDMVSSEVSIAGRVVADDRTEDLLLDTCL